MSGFLSEGIALCVAIYSVHSWEEKNPKFPSWSLKLHEVFLKVGLRKAYDPSAE